MLILVFILIGITAGYMLRNIKALKNVDRTIQSQYAPFCLS